MKIHAVITTHNRAKQLLNCLWTVCELGILKPDLIAIVDDASIDETPDLGYRLPAMFRVPIKYMYRDRQNKSWANPAIPRNMAIRLAGECDHLLFLEPEMLLFQDTLIRMAARLGEHIGENVWVNAVHQGFIHRPLKGEEARNPEWVWKQSDWVRVDPSPHLAVRCALMPREAVYALHGYDETFYGWGTDDTDWMTRMQTYGCRRMDDFSVRILHQWHEAAPANAETANANLAISQRNMNANIYAVNDPLTWGTDNGRYPELAKQDVAVLG